MTNTIEWHLQPTCLRKRALRQKRAFLSLLLVCSQAFCFAPAWGAFLAIDRFLRFWPTESSVAGEDLLVKEKECHDNPDESYLSVGRTSKRDWSEKGTYLSIKERSWGCSPGMATEVGRLKFGPFYKMTGSIGKTSPTSYYKRGEIYAGISSNLQTPDDAVEAGNQFEFGLDLGIGASINHSHNISGWEGEQSDSMLMADANFIKHYPAFLQEDGIPLRFEVNLLYSRRIAKNYSKARHEGKPTPLSPWDVDQLIVGVQGDLYSWESPWAFDSGHDLLGYLGVEMKTQWENTYSTGFFSVGPSFRVAMGEDKNGQLQEFANVVSLTPLRYAWRFDSHATQLEWFSMTVDVGRLLQIIGGIP